MRLCYEMMIPNFENQNNSEPIPLELYIGLTKQVIQLLPENIDKDVRRFLELNHPDPEIIVEKKIKDDNFEIEKPIEVSEDDYESYCIGIVILNEIATESLTLEILNQYVSTELTMNLLPSNAFNYIEALWENHKEDDMVGLIQHLQIAYLTGNIDEFNYYFSNHYQGGNLLGLAIELGNIAKNGSHLDNTNTPKATTAGRTSPKEFGKIFLDFTKSEWHSLSSLTEILELESETQTLPLLNDKNRIEGMGIMGLIKILSGKVKHSNSVTYTAVDTILHELIHYLSIDHSRKRNGLMHLKTSN